MSEKKDRSGVEVPRAMAQLTASEAGGPTIVGGQPPVGRRQTTIKVPVGMEKLLYLAASDETFAEALVAERLAAVTARGLALRGSEAEMLRLISEEQLRAAIAGVDLSQQQAFLRAVALSVEEDGSVSPGIQPDDIGVDLESLGRFNLGGIRPDDQPPPGASQLSLDEAPASASDPNLDDAPTGEYLVTPVHLPRRLVLYLEGREYPVTELPFIIGRVENDCSLAIRRGDISKRHCAITLEDGHYILEDLRSTNGIAKRAGDQVQPVVRAVIADGDCFLLPGDMELRCRLRPVEDD